MDTKNYLAASDLAYKNLQEEQKIRGIDGVEYQVVKALHTKSGYDGYILHRKDTNELIAAHRGTWPEKGQLAADILTDLGMAVHQASNQYANAKRLTEMAIEFSKTRYPNAAIRQTGHSLGGALAQMCGYNYGHQTETFNAYGAAALTHKLGGRQSNVALITNHVRATDPVSAASQHLGKVEHYLNSAELYVLVGGGYGGGLNAIRPNRPWQVAVAGAVMDHGLDNFQKGGLSDTDRQFAVKWKRLVEEFRSDFEKEAREAGGIAKRAKEEIDKFGRNAGEVKEKIDEMIRKGMKILNSISTDLHMQKDRVVPDGPHNPAAVPDAVQTAQLPQTKYDEVRAMLHGLKNDTDGSYAQKLLADHPEQVARFEEKVRQRMEEEQNRQQELAARESQNAQEQEQQRGFSRSFG